MRPLIQIGAALIAVVFVSIGLQIEQGLKAQQTVTTSQYLFNGLVLNPAYAGSHDGISTTVSHRAQWAQFIGSPTTQVVAIHGHWAGGKMGAGLLLTNDQIGINSALEATLNLSYRLQLTSGELAFGLRGGFSSYHAALSDVVVWDPGDPVYAQDELIANVPKFGAGVYYHNDTWYAGLSVPTLIAWDVAVRNGEVPFYQRNVYATAGYLMALENWISIKPSMLVTLTNGQRTTIDCNLQALISKKVWLGTGYRSNASWVALFEYLLPRGLRIGYAHDFSSSDIVTFLGGSNQIMVGWDIGLSE